MSGFATHRTGAFVLGVALLFGATLHVQKAYAASNLYMKIDSIQGEATDNKHAGWIEIMSFRLDVGTSTMGSAASGGGAGRNTIHSAQITKRVDSATAKLFEAATTGAHLKNVVIEQVAPSGRTVVITLEDAFVSSVRNMGASGGTAPMETVEFRFAQSTTSYAATQRMNAMPAMERPSMTQPH